MQTIHVHCTCWYTLNSADSVRLKVSAGNGFSGSSPVTRRRSNSPGCAICGRANLSKQRSPGRFLRQNHLVTTFPSVNSRSTCEFKLRIWFILVHSHFDLWLWPYVFNLRDKTSKEGLKNKSLLHEPTGPLGRFGG